MGHSHNLGISTIDASIEQKTDEVIDLWVHKIIATHTLTAGVSIDDLVLPVTDSTGILAGQTICIKEDARHFQADVLSVSVNNVTIDSPLDFAFTTAAIVHNANKNMAVDGSGTTQTFHIEPPAGAVWHLTRVLFTMTDGTAMDDSKFGGISGLTNGFVMRLKNGRTKNIFNIKTNGDFAAVSYDVNYAPKAPAGSFGLNVRSSFNGEDKRGIVFPLIGNDSDQLQILIQDDLTDLVTFRARFQGHRKST